jgi:hypothetical protein
VQLGDMQLNCTMLSTFKIIYLKKKQRPAVMAAEMLQAKNGCHSINVG